MPRALVVADDLTGAMDIAHAFAIRGYRTRGTNDVEREELPDSHGPAVGAASTQSRTSGRGFLPPPRRPAA